MVTDTKELPMEREYLGKLLHLLTTSTTITVGLRNTTAAGQIRTISKSKSSILVSESNLVKHFISRTSHEITEK